MPTTRSAAVASARATAFRRSSTAATRSCSANNASSALGWACRGFLVMRLRSALGLPSLLRKTRPYLSSKAAALAGASLSSQSRIWAARYLSDCLPSSRAVAAFASAARSNASSVAASSRTVARVSSGFRPRPRRVSAISPSRLPARAIPCLSFSRSLSSSAMSWEKSSALSIPARRDSASPAGPTAAPPANNRSRASMRISRARRSSSTEKCGASLASTGNRPSRDSENEWMVRMRNPSGVSRVAANSLRAVSVCIVEAGFPSRFFRSLARALSPPAAQWPRRVLNRVATSAAAALV